MKNLLLCLLAAGLLGIPRLSAQDGASATGLSDQEYESVFKLCRLKPQESAWDKLPWETNLWSALTKASREKKLLLLWSAGGGGHPLGMC